MNNRKRVIYIGLLLIITVIVSITTFSYAFLTRLDEQHGKLNMTVGTLDYKIESTDLNSNNQITLPASTEKKIEVEITSLNTISSKYELFYTTTNNSVDVDYSTLKDDAAGTIAAGSKKTVVIRVSNPSNTSATITFNVQGGFTYNNLVLSTGNSIDELDPITVTFDRGNLVYNLENTDEIEVTNMKYSIANGVVTVTATADSNYGFTDVKTYLEAGKTYVFNCDTDGTWGSTNGQDLSYAFLHLISSPFGAYVSITNNHNFEFTAAVTGEYMFRFLSLKSGTTHKFWNISVTEKNPTTKQLVYGEEYGTLPTEQERDGYIFKGWNGKNLLNYNNILEEAKSIGIVVDNDGYISDNTPMSDGRIWKYSNSNWHLKLATGIYNMSLIFKNQISSDKTSSDLVIFNDDNVAIYDNGYNLTNKEKVTVNFTLFKETKIGIFMKSYDGVYRIQLEEGSVATPFEPCYLDSTTPVTRTSNHTVKAIWEKKTAKFIQGNTFNYMIKELAGDDTTTQTYRHNYFDYRITEIKKADSLPANFVATSDNIVSTSDSDYPIYVWYDNGTIYYYSEAIAFKTNGYMYSMFRALRNVENIDILPSLDTSLANDMGAAFFVSSSLRNINLSSFDTSNVTNMEVMFNAYTSNNYLTSLDLSTFNMSKVTNTTDMLSHLDALTELKTPKVYPTDVNVKITLPVTMYDISGNAYTVLDNTSPTETLLKTSWN